MLATWPDHCRRALRRVRYLGWARYCPLCGSHVRLFFPHGVVQRPNAVCPVCHSRDRHRLAWLWLQTNTALGRAPMRMLHVAPEPVVARRLQALPRLLYVSGDLVHHATVQMDVCRMPFAANSFDLVYCSHVLNMLPDDQPAMTEIFRVLCPGGLALLQVPTPVAGRGVEAGPVSTADQRQHLFGDPDMYRRYGADELTTRLRGAGFDARPVHYWHSFSEDEQLRLGLIDEPLHICFKPATP